MIVHVIWMSSRHVSSDSTHTTHEVCSVSPNCSSFAMSGSYLSATPLIKVAQPYPSGSSPSVLSFSFATSKAGPTGSNSICQARGKARPRYTVPFMTVSRIGSQLSSSQMPPSSPSTSSSRFSGILHSGCGVFIDACHLLITTNSYWTSSLSPVQLQRSPALHNGHRLLHPSCEEGLVRSRQPLPLLETFDRLLHVGIG